MRVDSKYALWTATIARFAQAVRRGGGLLRLAVAMTVASVAIHPANSAPASPLVGQLAPDFALRSLQQTTFRLSEFRGEVVLIHFWASWCGECRQAMPQFNAMYEKYHRAGLVMLSVNLDDDLHRAEDMSESLKIPFPVLYDERKEVGKLYLLEQMPLTVLIDRSGTVQHAYVGFDLGDERKYLEQIRDLLNQ